MHTFLCSLDLTQATPIPNTSCIYRFSCEKWQTLANTQCASKVHKHCALAMYICSYSGRGHLCTERWALQTVCHVTSTTSGTRLSKISRNDLKHARRPDCWCGVMAAQRRTRFHAPWFHHNSDLHHSNTSLHHSSGSSTATWAFPTALMLLHSTALMWSAVWRQKCSNWDAGVMVCLVTRLHPCEPQSLFPTLLKTK